VFGNLSGVLTIPTLWSEGKARVTKTIYLVTSSKNFDVILAPFRHSERLSGRSITKQSLTYAPLKLAKSLSGVSDEEG
jgi:hypothetical protein